ncbi:MAG: Hsp20/alpha crystallin family protein [Gammaproteobacteria bacterium]
MSLIPRRSFFDLDDMFEAWPALRPSGDGSMTPRVDIRDKGDHYEITAELPGVNKDDLEVTLEDGVLSIAAETRQEDKEEKDGKVIRQERRYGRFVRSFQIGEGVREEDIEASFNDGVLCLKAPKTKPEPPAEPRRISVS